MKLDYFKKRKTQKNQHGFTLVEFVVIIGIFSIMAGVTAFNFKDFEGSVDVNNMANNLALTITQAKSYGLSAAGPDLLNIGSGDSVNVNSNIVDAARRGVQFTFNGQYEPIATLYADSNSQGDRNQFDEEDVVIDRILLSQQVEIVDVCAGDLTSVACWQDVLGNANGNLDPGNIDIVFTRPNPDARIFVEDGGAAVEYSYLQIIVADQDTSNVRYKTVNVTSAGGIYVN